MTLRFPVVPMKATMGSTGASIGAITISNTNSTYVTITAAGNAGTCNNIYVPKGWAACCFKAMWSSRTALLVSSSTSAYYSVRYNNFLDDPYVASAGVAYAATNTVSDRFAIGQNDGMNGQAKLRQIPLRANTSNSSYLTFHGQQVNGGVTGNVCFYVLLVKIA
jgi:hypothetical protein